MYLTVDCPCPCDFAHASSSLAVLCFTSEPPPLPVMLLSPVREPCLVVKAINHLMRIYQQRTIAQYFSRSWIYGSAQNRQEFYILLHKMATTVHQDVLSWETCQTP